jgi:hypothetical protein
MSGNLRRSHKLVQADLYVMASQCEIAKDQNPDRIERIQSFKGSALVLAQLFQFVAYVQIYAHFYLDLEHVLWRPKNFGRHFLDIQVKCK